MPTQWRPGAASAGSLATCAAQERRGGTGRVASGKRRGPGRAGRGLAVRAWGSGSWPAGHLHGEPGLAWSQRRGAQPILESICVASR